MLKQTLLGHEDEQPLKEFVYDFGIKVLGSRADFTKWLSCSMLALDGKCPKDLSMEELYEEIKRLIDNSY